jgi:hypothetical protein
VRLFEGLICEIGLSCLDSCSEVLSGTLIALCLERGQRGCRGTCYILNDSSRFSWHNSGN